MTKITGLTRDNVSALREVFPEAIERGLLVLTASTATWRGEGSTAAEITTSLDRTMDTLPTNGHPRASLHAVRRKLAKVDTGVTA